MNSITLRAEKEIRSILSSLIKLYGPDREKVEFVFAAMIGMSKVSISDEFWSSVVSEDGIK